VKLAREGARATAGKSRPAEVRKKIKAVAKKKSERMTRATAGRSRPAEVRKKIKAVAKKEE
jgi:uncharacterized protein YfcZ (UPF0381/DUF406 family)